VLVIRRLRGSAALCAIGCTALIAAGGGAAFAAAGQPAQERYYSSYEAPDVSRSVAREHYYSSYGEPESLALSQAPAPSDDAPWLPIALAVAGTLIVVGASATQVRRLRFRRRRTAGASL
jgi:hypothetical protein